MGASGFSLDQHHVGSHRADHGPKHKFGVISDEGARRAEAVTKSPIYQEAAVQPVRADPLKRYYSLTEEAPLPTS
jgi:hypothetical protein